MRSKEDTGRYYSEEQRTYLLLVIVECRKLQAPRERKQRWEWRGRREERVVCVI
jgi:hypothetical protein